VKIRYLLALVWFIAVPAHANTTLVVQLTPGQPIDILSRKIASTLQNDLGTIVVENRFGAGGELAVKSVVGRPGDGKTLLVAVNGILSVTPHTKELSFDVFKDLTPVTILTRVPYVFFVGPMVPENARSVSAFLDLMKKNEKFRLYGSPGQGTVPELVAGVLFKNLGVQTQVVRFRGSPDTVQNVMNPTANVPSGFLMLSDIAHLLHDKRVPLAVSGHERSALAPHVPTFRELGFEVPDVSWSAVYAPADTPLEVRRRISALIKKALTPDVIQWGANIGMTVYASTPEELAGFHESEFKRWGTILRK